MGTVLIAAMIVAGVLVIFILLSNIKVSLQFSADVSECILSIQIRFLYGLIRINRNVDLKKLAEKLKENKMAEEVFRLREKIKEEANAEKMKGIKLFLWKQLPKIQIHRFVWRSSVGLNDAAATGVLSGAVWTLKGTASAWLKSLSCMKCAPEISLDPCFQSYSAKTNLSCMVSIRTGKAIWTILQLYLQRKKLQNGRTDDGTSNQRCNDNGHGESKGNDRCEHDHRRSG